MRHDHPPYTHKGPFGPPGATAIMMRRPRRCARRPRPSWSGRSAATGLVLLATPLAAAPQVVDTVSSHRPAQPGCTLSFEVDRVMGGIRAQAAPEQPEFASILGTAITPSGDVYVADGVLRRIFQVGPDGRLVRTFGSDGTGPGELRSVSRVATAGGRVYALDRALNRIVVWDTSGAHLRTRDLPFFVRAHPSLAATPDRLYLPGLQEGLAPELLASSPVIHEFDAEITHLRSFGRPPRLEHESSRRLLSSGTLLTAPDGFWFLPIAAYELRRYDRAGRLRRLITRRHDFAYDPRPYVQTERLGPDAVMSGLDHERALNIGIGRDAAGRIWVFTRDNPRNRIVIDVFEASGRWLQTHAYPLDVAPVRMGEDGFFYRYRSRAEVPRITRLRPVWQKGDDQEETTCDP